MSNRCRLTLRAAEGRLDPPVYALRPHLLRQWREVLVEPGLHVDHRLHSQLNGVDGLVLEAYRQDNRVCMPAKDCMSC